MCYSDQSRRSGSGRLVCKPIIDLVSRQNVQTKTCNGPSHYCRSDVVMFGMHYV